MEPFSWFLSNSLALRKRGAKTLALFLRYGGTVVQVNATSVGSLPQFGSDPGTASPLRNNGEATPNRVDHVGTAVVVDCVGLGARQKTCTYQRSYEFRNPLLDGHVTGARHCPYRASFVSTKGAQPEMRHLNFVLATLITISWVSQLAFGAENEPKLVGEKTVAEWLEQLEKGEKSRLAAAAQLKQVGRYAIPVWNKALRNKNKLIRRQAATALASFGRRASSSVDQLLKALKDKDKGVRSAAIVALGKIGMQPKKVIPALVKKLKDRKPETRAAAATAIGGFKHDAQPVLKKVVRLLSDSSTVVRAATVQAVADIGGEPDVIFPKLVNRLKDEEVDVRLATLKALDGFGQEAQRALPALMRALEDETEAVRALAIRVVGRVSEPENGLEALVNALQDPSSLVRENAVVAIGDYGARGAGALASLVAMLNDEEVLVRSAAASSIGQMEAEALPALDGLLAALKDPAPEVRLLVVGVIGRLGIGAIRAAPTIVRLFDQETDVAVLSSAALALGELGAGLDARADKPALDKMVAALTKLKRHKNRSVQAGAKQGLRFIRRRAKR